MKVIIKSRMSSNVGQIRLRIAELEDYINYFDDFTCRLSGERSLPFGLLVFFLATKEIS